MTPGNLPLALYRGDSYVWRFTIWADAEKTQPADLTGVVAKSEIRDMPGGATIVPLTCTVELPNVIEAVLSAVESAKLPLAGAWDLQLTYLDGSVATILAGAVMVTADVTDSGSGTTARASGLLAVPRLIPRTGQAA